MRVAEGERARRRARATGNTWRPRAAREIVSAFASKPQESAAAKARGARLTAGGWRWPLSPQSVSSMPSAPQRRPQETASRTFSRALLQRPTKLFQLEVPGHTWKGTPASAKRGAWPEKPARQLPRVAEARHRRGHASGIDAGLARRLVEPGVGADALLRELGDQLGMLEHDVAPELDVAPAAVEILDEAQQELEVDAPGAALGAGAAGCAPGRGRRSRRSPCGSAGSRKHGSRAS